MAVINGGLVLGFTTADDLAFVTREHRHLLLQHRSKLHNHLFDSLLRVCPDLQYLWEYVGGISDHWQKAVRGRVIGRCLITYMNYFLFPQQKAYRGDLVFFATYIIIKGYFQRLIKLLIDKYDMPNKYYAFKIKKDNLYKLSCQFYDDMETTAKKMIVHHNRLTSK